MLAQNKDNLSGQQIDNYKLEYPLTRHKRSTLYLAADVQTDQQVLVEVSAVSSSEDQIFADAFQHNMAIVQILGHPNIASILTIGQTDDQRPFAAMENTPAPAVSAKIAFVKVSVP